MSIANSLHQSFGGLELPVIGSPTDLTALDPARRILADLFKAAINAELGTVWASAVTASGATIGALPVTDVLEMAPSRDAMQQRKADFPLLAVYRSGKGTYEPHTLYEERLTQAWTVDWILGPADIATAFKLTDAAVAVAKIIQQVISRRGHLAYQEGAPQFGAERGDLGAIRIVEHEGPGQAQFAGSEDGQWYWAITITLETIEYVTPNEQAVGQLEGADYDFHLGGPGDGLFAGLFYGSTDAP